MDTYNLLYDELQKKIIQTQKKHFLDDLAFLAFMRERVIVADTRRDPEAIASTNLAFAGAVKSNTQCLMAENKQLAKNLQVARKEVEQLRATTQNTASAQVHLEEMKVATLHEVSGLGETMRDLYEELVTVIRQWFVCLACSNSIKTSSKLS